MSHDKYVKTRRAVISLFRGVSQSAKRFLSHVLYCDAVFSFPSHAAGPPGWKITLHIFIISHSSAETATEVDTGIRSFVDITRKQSREVNGHRSMEGNRRHIMVFICEMNGKFFTLVYLYDAHTHTHTHIHTHTHTHTHTQSSLGQVITVTSR